MAKKKIGILFGMENSFPPAVVEKINSMKIPDIEAESVKIGAIRMNEPRKYAVIIDRISQDIPFYRAYLKNAALHGTFVVNNPFWWTADDKFFNYALADKLGVAIPPTVILPHNTHPPDTTDRSMRNLVFPLNWDDVFAYVGFPAFLKPYAGGGWKHVYKVHSAEEFFNSYNQTGDLCMTLQHGVEFDDYYRCYVVGQEKVHLMKYDPRMPFHERYVRGNPAPPPALKERIEKDCLTLCRALGYDLNTVEFAVEGGVPYAIDFLNPAPDFERDRITEFYFEMVVDKMSRLVIDRALSGVASNPWPRWEEMLGVGAASGVIGAPKAAAQVATANVTAVPSAAADAGAKTK